MHRHQRYQNELLLLNELISQKPQDWYLHRLRGEAAWRLEEDDLAISDLRLVAVAGQAFPHTWDLLSQAYRRRGRLKQDVADLSHPLAIQPGNGHLWQLRGMLHVYQENDNEAASDFRKAYENGARDLVHRQFADCLIRLRRWEEACEALQRAVDYERLEFPLREQLIYAYLKNGELLNAHREIERAILHHRNTKDPVVANRLAWLEACYRGRENPYRVNPALSEFSISHAPNNPDYLTTNALARQLDSGRDARPQLQQAIEARVQVNPWREWLVLALEEQRNSNLQEGRVWLDRALAITSDELDRLSWTERLDFDHLAAWAKKLLQPKAP